MVIIVDRPGRGARHGDLAAARRTSRSSTRCRWPARRGKLNAVDLSFDWNDRYNLWSGLIGGMFLALAYFGTDQSQVQRYLTGKSIAQSRLSLLFNAVAKVPMQFLILFIGAMVFVFYRLPAAAAAVRAGRACRGWRAQAGYSPVAERFSQAFEERQGGGDAVGRGAPQWRRGARGGKPRSVPAAQKELDAARAEGAELAEKASGKPSSTTRTTSS